MSVFFRPPLMILGLVASIAMLNPVVAFFNEAFMLSFRVLQTDSFTTILQVGGVVMVYCFILLSIFSLTFALPQTLPDRILRWVGAGIGDLGEQQSMGRVESAASGAARMAYTSGSQKSAARSAATRDAQKARRAEEAQSARDATQQQLADAQLRTATALEGFGGQSTITGNGTGGEGDTNGGDTSQPEGQGGQSTVTGVKEE